MSVFFTYSANHTHTLSVDNTINELCSENLNEARVKIFGPPKMLVDHSLVASGIVNDHDFLHWCNICVPHHFLAQLAVIEPTQVRILQ